MLIDAPEALLLFGVIPYYDPADPGTEYVLADIPAGRLVERLRPGCFAECARGKPPARCEVSHNPAAPLGHSGAGGAMRWWADSAGLHFGIVLDGVNAEVVADWLAAGRPLGASFNGKARCSLAVETLADGRPVVVRWVERVHRLEEVGPTDHPAYRASRCWID